MTYSNLLLSSFFLSILNFNILLAQEMENTTSENTISGLNQFMDQWHLAAAKADAEGFFGSMAVEGVYIGTDKTERWLRDELRDWSAAAFERESAWTFVSQERNWQILEEKELAICDELLQTWMGPCRATAVLEKRKNTWQIIHYQLSVTIDNDKIEDFKQLVSEP